MKLWLLRPLKDEEGPWKEYYDTCGGFVIAANTEEDARLMANQHGGDETRKSHINWNDRVPVWTDPSLASCVELVPPAEPDIIMSDFRAG